MCVGQLFTKRTVQLNNRYDYLIYKFKGLLLPQYNYPYTVKIQVLVRHPHFTTNVYGSPDNW